MKGTINIDIEHKVGTNNFSVYVKCEATPNMVVAACADLLATVENELPEQARQGFRNDFLQALNSRRVDNIFKNLTREDF